MTVNGSLQSVCDLSHNNAGDKSGVLCTHRLSDETRRVLTIVRGTVGKKSPELLSIPSIEGA